MPERIDARLSQRLAAQVDRMVCKSRPDETPSEYVRDPIRRDMERREGPLLQKAILEGYRDLEAGRLFASSGDYRTDMARLAEKETSGW